MSRLQRPPRRPLTDRQKTLVSAIVGVGAILLGALFLIGPNISYAPGDIRASSGYSLFTGGLAIALGIIVLVSIPVRSNCRKDKE